MPALSCTPSNDLMPLRGEDPQALALSGERADWVSKSGATRSFERFRVALQEGDVEEALKWLGPRTRTVLALRAAEAGVTPVEVFRRGGIADFDLPGSDDPIRDLRVWPDAGPVREEGPYDPIRTAVILVVPRAEGASPIMVPMVHTEDGWRVEIVRSLPGSTDTASERSPVRPPPPTQEER